MRNNLVRVMALVLLATLAFGSGYAVMPASAQPAISKDCVDCPDMVSLPDGSAIGEYPVTRDQFAIFAAETSFEGKGCAKGFGASWSMDPDADWTAPGFEQAGDHPVVCVNWLDATAYVDWLAEKTGKPYRLPTFEESDAAYIAGGTGPYSWGADEGAICGQGNVADASYVGTFADDQRKILTCDDGFTYTSPVTAFAPNAYGLHDTIGNVWQWTNSCLNGDCANAIMRGGGWNVPVLKWFQQGQSWGDRIMLRNFVIGFRVFRDAE